MKTHRKYAFNKQSLIKLAEKWPYLAGAVFLTWAFSAMSSCASKEDIQQKSIDGHAYKLIGPHSVFYEQSDKSALSFHFNSKTIHVENHDDWDDGVEGFHLRGFSRFEAPDLIEDARQAGCSIADNFNENRAAFENELSKGDFEKLDARLPVFANNYCDNASETSARSSEPEPEPAG